MQEQQEISYQKFEKKRPRWTKRLRRDLEYYSMRGGVVLGNWLPLEVLQFLGRCLGRSAYYLLWKDRGIVEQQLALVFKDIPASQRKKWTYECFLHYGQMLFEILGVERWFDQSNQRIRVYGESLLKEGYERGKGTIVLGAHIGNWELLTYYFERTGYSAKVAVTPIYDERLNEFFVKLRQRGGITLIPRGAPQSAREILLCFKQNEIFFVIIDQDTDVSSMFIPFFDIPALTPIVAASLALKTGALVLSAMVIRQPCGQFDVQIERVGVFEKKKPNRRDLYEVGLQFNQHLEKIIRRYPSQWAWFHRRWKHRPSVNDLQFLKEMNSVKN